MRIRPEEPRDADAIDAVVLHAFGEHDEGPVVVRLVELLRSSPGYRPELALVADDVDGVVGHVMFTDAEFEGATVLILSPLAVRPDRQRTGIGSALVGEGLARAEATGVPLVVIEGDPRYYSRFGFRRALELGIEKPRETTPEWAFKALAFTPEHPRGKFGYTRPFDEVE